MLLRKQRGDLMRSPRELRAIADGLIRRAANEINAGAGLTCRARALAYRQMALVREINERARRAASPRRRSLADIDGVFRGLADW
jgi:hypothetical protein